MTGPDPCLWEDPPVVALWEKKSLYEVLSRVNFMTVWKNNERFEVMVLFLPTSYEFCQPLMNFANLLWFLLCFFNLLWFLLCFFNLLWILPTSYEFVQPFMNFSNPLWFSTTIYEFPEPFMNFLFEHSVGWHEPNMTSLLHTLFGLNIYRVGVHKTRLALWQ